MATVTVNTSYFKEIVKRSGLAPEEFGFSVGQGKWWVKNVIARKTAKDYAINAIVKSYGADYFKLTNANEEQKEEVKTEQDPRMTLVEFKTLEILARTVVTLERKVDRLIAMHGD